MNTKPIIRWTIGPASSQGFEILRASVEAARRILPEFERVICYNHDGAPAGLAGVDARLFRQHHNPTLMEYPPEAEKWKFYPPRLDLDAHEIVLDNDIILFGRPPLTDNFLACDRPLIYEGVNGYHGKYASRVPVNRPINSGLYGMPPSYDFAAAIRQTQADDTVRNWETHWDDQGLIGATLGCHPDPFWVSQLDIPCCEKKLLWARFGYHFVGANGGPFHPAWQEFCRRRPLL